jgi:hypothetical protein
MSGRRSFVKDFLRAWFMKRIPGRFQQVGVLNIVAIETVRLLLFGSLDQNKNVSPPLKT